MEATKTIYCIIVPSASIMILVASIATCYNFTIAQHRLHFLVRQYTVQSTQMQLNHLAPIILDRARYYESIKSTLHC